MKSKIAEQRKTSENVPCYYIPKIFISDTKYKDYSLDCKILAGIMISMAKCSNEVIEAIKLLDDVGEEQLTKLMRDLKEVEEQNNG